MPPKLQPTLGEWHHSGDSFVLKDTDPVLLGEVNSRRSELAGSRLVFWPRAAAPAPGPCQVRGRVPLEGRAVHVYWAGGCLAPCRNHFNG